MRTTLLLFAALALLTAGCSKKETAQAAKPTNSSYSSGNPITAPVDYLGAVGQAKRLAEKTVSRVSLDKDIQLFHEAEGRYPKDLNELVKEHYIPAVPQPPYGMKFDYNPATGQFRVLRQ